jgi:hypothetical protein
LRGADLLLSEDVWEKGKSELPPGGIQLLAGSAFDWAGTKRVRVREQRMEANGQVYVLGTLDEAHRMKIPRRIEWRKRLIDLTPALLRGPMLVAIGYLELLGVASSSKQQDVPLPNLDATAVVVWKGSAGRPLIVSNQRETAAASQLRKRSLWYIGIGIAILCWLLYELTKTS